MKETEWARHGQLLLPRRTLLRGLGTMLAVAPAVQLLGCSDDGSTDGPSGTDGLSDFTFQTQKMADGAMLAWKAIVIHA